MSMTYILLVFFFFSSRRRHTRFDCDWSSDVCSSDLVAALQESEAQYRALFQSTPYPMWVFDLETHRVLAVNGAAIKHYGYSREEFLALRIEDLRPAEDIPALHRHLERSEEHTSELQSQSNLVCRLLLEK